MKPMLAAPTDGTNLRYPLMASPKLDGIRAIVKDGVVLSRSLKPIPNRAVQLLFGACNGGSPLEGCDGELIVGPPGAVDVYNRTTSGVMSADGEPDVRFHVFDMFGLPHGFKDRHEIAKHRIRSGPGLVSLLAHKMLKSEDELVDYEAKQLILGFEGVMLRDPNGLYKHGRSTLKEQGLLKLKRFADSEATIIGAIELMENTNESVRNALGYLEKSTKKAGKVGKGMLGALQVRDLKTGVEFEVGSGFTEAQRSAFWGQYLAQHGPASVGGTIKYKYQPVGVKEKPRFPVFLGFRDSRDM